MDATVSLAHHRQFAERAYRGTSFSPEKRGSSTITEFEQMLREDLDQVPNHYKEKYRQKFESYFTGWLSSKSRCVSSMITGPSNFPAARMQKYNRWEDNKFKEFMAWRERIIKALARSERKRNGPSELEQAVKNLADRVKTQEFMKAVNKVVNKPNAAELLAAMNISAGDIHNLLNPKFSYEKKGFQTYQLSNNNANIKRLEDRVKLLQKKEQTKQAIADGAAEVPEVTIHGAIIRKDFSDDRLKVIFDGKPAANVITALKSRGFRWSPFLKAWCRKLTNAAFYDAKEICEKEISTSSM